MHYTEHYQLNQWEANDKVQRTDFNADNTKLDGALHRLAQEKAERGKVEELQSALAALEQKMSSLPKLATGTYTGTGSTTMSLSLPFRPRFALIRNFTTQDEGAYIFEDQVSFHERETGGRSEVSNDSYKVVRRNNGLSLVCNYTWEGNEKAAMVCNRSKVPYYYVALG